MIKKILAIITVSLAVLSLCVACTVTTPTESGKENNSEKENISAETYENGLSNFYYTQTDDGVTITGIKDSSVTEVYLPSSVKKIEKTVFEECKNIRKVYTPSLEAWCEIEFVNERDAIAYSNPLALHLFDKEIEPAEFYVNGEILTSIKKDDNIKSIKGYAFTGCVGLTSVEIPDTVTDVGFRAFGGCLNLASVVINVNLYSIDDYAFIKCENLTSVEIGGYISYAGEGIFFYCQKLKSVVIGGGIYVSGRTFYNCSSLESIVIPDGVTTIGSGAFYNCSGLESVIIPDSVTVIGEDAFYNCQNLEYIVIGEGVTSIEIFAFEYCGDLESVYYKGTAEDWEDILIESYGNSYIVNATKYYYIENQEDLPTDGGNYWHYDENGLPIKW